VPRIGVATQALLGFPRKHRCRQRADRRLHPGRMRAFPAGMPILWALADPKTGEREVLTAMLDVEPQLAAARPGLTLITDKGFPGRETEADLADRGITLLRPARKDEQARHGQSPPLQATAVR